MLILRVAHVKFMSYMSKCCPGKNAKAVKPLYSDMEVRELPTFILFKDWIGDANTFGSCCRGSFGVSCFRVFTLERVILLQFHRGCVPRSTCRTVCEEWLVMSLAAPCQMQDGEIQGRVTGTRHAELQAAWLQSILGNEASELVGFALPIPNGLPSCGCFG